MRNARRTNGLGVSKAFMTSKTATSQRNNMTLSKILPAFSLALAMIGTAVVIAPSPAKAGGHISNGALAHDRIPCSDRGPAKANCRPGAPANHHTRGCSAITRCRG